MALPKSIAGQDVGTKESTPAEPTNASPLLYLPAELRNRIYEAALVSRREIRITHGHVSPALLVVNKQIRQEATAIYLLGNSFYLRCPQLDSTLLYAFVRRNGPIAEKMLAQESLKIGITHHDMNWTNLEEWLRNYFSFGSVRLRPMAASLDFVSRTWNAVARPFDIVEDMRGKLTWEEVPKLLLVYKATAEEQAAGTWSWS